MKEIVNDLQRQSLKTTQLQEWVGGWVGGQAMVHYNQSYDKSRPSTQWYPDSQMCVRKIFLLLSFLTQQKTTFIDRKTERL